METLRTLKQVEKSTSLTDQLIDFIKEAERGGEEVVELELSPAHFDQLLMETGADLRGSTPFPYIGMFFGFPIRINRNVRKGQVWQQS